MNHRKWFVFTFGIALFAWALFFDYTTALPSSNPYLLLDILNPAADFLDFLILAPALISLSLIYLFLRSKRIEFYEDHVRIFTRLGSKRTEYIPYSNLELGILKLQMVRTAMSFHFKLFKRGSQKASWDVADGKLHNSDKTIYFYLKDRVLPKESRRGTEPIF